MPDPVRGHRKVLEACPTCGGPLIIAEVRCERCGTEVRSRYEPCPFCRLSPEQINFMSLFVQSRGNLSEVEKTLGVSYPTIRAKLDEVIRLVVPQPTPAAPAPPPPPTPATPPGPVPDLVELLRRPTPAPPAPVVPPAPPSTPAAAPAPGQREILAQVAAGKLSAAAALAALRAAPRPAPGPTPSPAPEPSREQSITREEEKQ